MTREALLLPHKENASCAPVWRGDCVEDRGMSVNSRKAGQPVGRGETGPGDGGGQRGCCGCREGALWVGLVPSVGSWGPPPSPAAVQSRREWRTAPPASHRGRRRLSPANLLEDSGEGRAAGGKFSFRSAQFKAIPRSPGEKSKAFLLHLYSGHCDCCLPASFVSGNPGPSWLPFICFPGSPQHLLFTHCPLVTFHCFLFKT